MNSDVTNKFTHLLLSSGSVKCTSSHSFLLLFRNDVNKKGVGIRAGRLENFSKINKQGGGRLFGTREYSRKKCC